MYYFKVLIDIGLDDYEHVIVKANDVFEAGEKVEKQLVKQNHPLYHPSIVEITRTNIRYVID